MSLVIILAAISKNPPGVLGTIRVIRRFGNLDV
jgi:hypothetical protein